MFDHAVDEGFIQREHRERLLVSADPIGLVDAVAAHAESQRQTADRLC